jgi:formamidopyrimidine-DNA glycosylase
VDKAAFQNFVVGQNVEALSRRSKYLIWTLSNNAHVVFHLGMSGRLGVFDAITEIEKHTHVIFYLSNEKQIRFRDPRRFGFVEVFSSDQNLNESERFKSLGPEPLTDEFNTKYFAQIITSSKRPIKLAIMDAKIVVGVGNIYANEALFFAGIHPDKMANYLSLEKCSSLVENIKSVLKKAISKGGTTLNDYKNANGEPGYFQQELMVYGREGQDCTKCGKTIKKIVLGQRSTFFCKNCQS